jgi:glucosamine kinase
VLGSSDPAAVAILDQAVADVAAAIAHLQGDNPVPVVFLGGLAPVFARALAGRWDMRAPLGTALDGALILAREAA